jgi:hypothetical protein
VIYLAGAILVEGSACGTHRDVLMAIDVVVIEMRNKW